jgi:ATP-dependent RNA helicase RhlE
MNFKDLKILPILLSNLEKAGYSKPTPIQERSIPLLLEGHDLLGIAQTGTGKTASFSLPIIQYLINNPQKNLSLSPRVLILAPTRELSLQIEENINSYAQETSIKTAIVFGGVGQAKQVAAMRSAPDILVATPGRLIDLMNQGFIKLDRIQIFVLDEADRMLDMGFINDIRKVVAKLPQKRQTVFFSATMPPEILSLSSKLLSHPKKVEVTPASSTVERIKQKIIRCQKSDKNQLLRKIITDDKEVQLTLVFTRTKHGANRIVEYLEHYKIKASAIHGNKSQSAREKALADFKEGNIKILIATDIAARGIDVDNITHVINFDLPVEAESYVHRIGRTARAGRDGVAISFCDETELEALKRIEKLIKIDLEKDRYQGTTEARVPKSKPYRDPRAKPEHRKPKSGKVGFKFKDKR